MAVRRTTVGILAVVSLATGWLHARTVSDFCDGWKFAKEGGPYSPVSVPHDWAIAGPFAPKGEGATGKLPWRGSGTYRKTVVLAAKPRGRFFLDFDGVMARATVFVNGQPCGYGEYGYLGFRADATPYMMVGTNVVEVRCDTLALKSRWYPGGGLYRRVSRTETDDVRFDDFSLIAETRDVRKEQARLVVRATICSSLPSVAQGQAEAVLKDSDGQVVARAKAPFAVAACDAVDVAFDLSVKRPQLWEMEPDAALYTLELSLRTGTLRDSVARRIGFREFTFDAARGFFLNGRRVQLKGVNLHSDLGPLGMAFNRDASRRQLQIMRDMGANAVRTSHNPPAPEFLDLCDEMGFFVWNECFDKWNATCGRGDQPLEAFVERQLRAFVRRDRLHPSVFVWSIGNEISPGKATPPGQESWAGHPSLGTSSERCTRFRAVVRSEDAMRPVGIGSCFPEAGVRGDYANLDVVGWNYGGKYIQMRGKYPHQPVVYSESASAVSEYGFYSDALPTNATDYARAARHVDSMDFNATSWSDIVDREFVRMARDTYCAGEFVWTGIDYLGEPTPYWHSARSSYFGICDLLAFPKDRYWLYRSYWNPSAFTLHLAPDHWTFPSRVGKSRPVQVYTSAETVELFLNGRSLGRRAKKPLAGDLKKGYYSVLPRYRLMWEDVVYEPGELKAVAYGNDGLILGERTLRTADRPVRVVLEPERRYGALCVVKVSLADANGVFVPGENRRVSFAAEGCDLLAVGNGDPHGIDSFKATASHPLAFGRAGVYVRLESGRQALLTASSEGLESATIEFKPHEKKEK